MDEEVATGDKMQDAQRVFVVLGLTAVLLGAWLGTTGPAPPPPMTLSDDGYVSTPAQEFVVHVSGWVVSPGVFTMAPGWIVADAVRAAGGAKEGARIDAINLSRHLVSGEHIEVPGPGESSILGALAEDGLVSINQADVEALQVLPGVGEVLASRIVDHREANGRFETLEDLLDVSGIGEAKLASIRDLITIR